MALIILLTGTALAATQVWHPQFGDNQRGHPSTIGSAPPNPELQALGVFRRPQEPPDRSSAVQDELKLVGPQLHGIYSQFIRNVAMTASGAVLIMAAQRFGDDVASQPETGVDEPICLLYPLGGAGTAPTGAAFPCWSLADVRAGRAVAEASPDGQGRHLFGLVPDGVERVSAEMDDGTSISTVVQDNFFDLPTNERIPAVRSIIWSDTRGNSIAKSARR